jgi:hypothetical protein
MNLSRFTRRLEECRKRWHYRTVRYVVEVALIVRAARKAAKDERRWGEWIRHETHMNRTTVYRYLRVAKFLKANVDLNQQLVSLSISKIYALARMKPEQAADFIKSGKAEQMSDIAFLRLTRRLKPKNLLRVTLPNLSKSLEASFVRLERCIGRWQHSALAMPATIQMRLQSRLHALSRTLERIGKASAVAM